MPFVHEPVMCQEIVELMREIPPGVIIDATLGGAGHSRALLNDRSDISVLGIDRDPIAREAATAALAEFGTRAQVAAGRFDTLSEVVAARSSDEPITGVLFDLGVSSPQLDDGDRGFSFRHDGPLDMRMNRDDAISAADVVNTWDEAEIERLLRDGADERFARRIAKAIVAARPLSTTNELAEVVTAAIPAATRRTGGHPAKRSFQAIRIAVNDELSQIPVALRDAINLLAPQGRGAVLAYHSGEDRLVKEVIARAEDGGCECPPRLPCACGAVRLVKVLSPRLRRPSDEECERNPRASSARLRCFERLDAAAVSR